MPFSVIKGQERAIERLRRCLASGSLPGAFLFSGPEGVGKKLAALALAKAVNCSSGQQDDFCGECVSCLKVEKGQHPDVRILDGMGSDIKIEDIRNLRREANFRPYEGRKKVFILNDAHNLNEESSNALLKTLEEPCPASVIILVTAKPRLLLKTVVSRCQAVVFYPLERGLLKNILSQDYQLHLHLAHFLAYYCEGSLGKALILKDSDILRKKNSSIDSFLFSANMRTAFQEKQTKEELAASFNFLAAWLRDLYMAKLGAGEKEVINFDRREEVLRMSGRYSFQELEEVISSIADYLLMAEQNINKKLLVSNLRAQLWKA